MWVLSDRWSACGAARDPRDTFGHDDIHYCFIPVQRPPFPQEIISHAVWLYYRFSLSDRDVEELLAERGIVVTYETMRQWCLQFGQQYANQLRRRRALPGDKRYLDEVYLKINGKTSYLWRAVDQDGNVSDSLVQSRRTCQGPPGTIVSFPVLGGLHHAYQRAT